MLLYVSQMHAVPWTVKHHLIYILDIWGKKLVIKAAATSNSSPIFPNIPVIFSMQFRPVIIKYWLPVTQNNVTTFDESFASAANEALVENLSTLLNQGESDRIIGKRQFFDFVSVCIAYSLTT